MLNQFFEQILREIKKIVSYVTIKNCIKIVDFDPYLVHRVLDSTYKLQTNRHRYVHFRTSIIELSGGFLNNCVDIKIFSFENYE